MSSKKLRIPEINLGEKLRDRGWATWVVICQTCEEKREVETPDETKWATCSKCGGLVMYYPEWAKRVDCKNINKMLPRVLLSHLQTLKNDYRDKGRHTIADLLDSRISGLSYALDGTKITDRLYCGNEYKAGKFCNMPIGHMGEHFESDLQYIADAMSI